MASFKITDLTELAGGSVNDSDVLEIVDLDADQSKKVTIASLKTVFAGSGVSEGDSYTGGTANGIMYNDGDTFATNADLTWDGNTLRQNATSGQLKYEGYISNVRKWRFQSTGSINIFNMSVNTLFDGSPIAMGAYDSSPDARLDIGITSSSEIGLIVEGASGQTAHYFDINSNGNSGGDVFSVSDDGITIPNLTTTERDAISSPANGLLIYNTTANQFQFYNGGLASWTAV